MLLVRASPPKLQFTAQSHPRLQNLVTHIRKLRHAHQSKSPTKHSRTSSHTFTKLTKQYITMALPAELPSDFIANNCQHAEYRICCVACCAKDINREHREVPIAHNKNLPINTNCYIIGMRPRQKVHRRDRRPGVQAPELSSAGQKPHQRRLEKGPALASGVGEPRFRS